MNNESVGDNTSIANSIDEKNRAYEAFLAAVRKYKMDELMRQAGSVVAAFSGGADSTVMLTFLHNYCQKNDIKLYAAHINHMIRGDDADSDEKFCREYALRLGVELYVKKADVPKIAEESGRGLEEAARLVRYDFFDELSEKLGGALIATAHNSSDNSETVIFNLMRGCGTHGISGIMPIRDGKFIRPLIELSGEEIRTYCRENQIPYVTDKTNADTEYTRNYIRHTVMPALSKLNAEPENAITKMTNLVRRDDDFILSTAREKLGERKNIPRSELNALHPAVSSRMLLLLYNSTKNGDFTIEERHIGEILRLSKEKSGESRLNVPGGMTAVIERGRVFFLPDEKETVADEFTPFRYPYDGNIYENKLYKVIFSHGEHNNHENYYNNNENIYKLSILRSFRFDKIKGVLIIRHRAEGDAYVFGGMRRKVKKLFIDKKMTSEEKALIPIFCDESGILWIPGFPMRDGTGSVNVETHDAETLSAETLSAETLTVAVYRKAGSD
ncbi:MAG: tRNA lysidine(34) synthetase TilS [Eubacteriales bacterium]